MHEGPPVTWLPRLRLALLILAVVVLQTTVFSAGLRVFGVMPDLGLVLTVAVAFYIGPERGAVFGFVSGLAVDLFLSTPLGLSALSFALVGYGAGIVQGGLVPPSRWVAPIMGAVGGLAGGVLFVGVGAIAGQDQLLALSSVRIILIASAYDALLAFAVFPIARWATRAPPADVQGLPEHHWSGGSRMPRWGPDRSISSGRSAE
jgi:rod shape-determining protein MreD